MPLSIRLLTIVGVLFALDAAALPRASHESWWRNYWEKSSVSVPNAVVERQWYLDTYKFGACEPAWFSADYLARSLDRRQWQVAAVEG